MTNYAQTIFQVRKKFQTNDAQSLKAFQRYCVRCGINECVTGAFLSFGGFGVGLV